MNVSHGANHSNEFHVEPDYCYESVTGLCKKIVQPLSLQFSMFFFMGLAIMITVGGNILVITVIAHFKQLHTTTNLLVLSLAVCDFLLGAFIMPCSVMRSIKGCKFLGDLVCNLHTSTDIMLCTCSILHLSFISIDRYIAICTPLLYQSINNSLATSLMITTSWLLSVIFSYGMIFSELNMKGSKIFVGTQVECVGGHPSIVSRTYAVLASTFGFFVPGVIMIGIYIKIYSVARHQAKSIKGQVQQVQAAGGKRSGDSGKSERKKENTLAVVVGAFLICWTPFFLCTIIDPCTGKSIPPLLFDTLYWFGYMNSSFNPLLYAFFYSWFRKALKIILSGKMFQRNSARMSLYSD